MRRPLFVLGALAVVVVVVVGLLQAGGDDQASSSPPGALSLAEVSKPVSDAPSELETLHRQVNVLRGGGKEAFDTQLRGLKGHPVVVNLWASWCGPCRFELPFLQSQAVKRAAKVGFLGIDVGDNRADARRFAAEFPMPYPSFVDPHEKLLARYGVKGLPATVFYGRDGQVKFVHQGVFATEQLLSEAIERYALS
ncbi:MAG: TlpA family protein disulfide reductase [Actinomycetota bacterium]|nr:TlpA family protein disulfide reductase [Actinomycetota bacterium]